MSLTSTAESSRRGSSAWTVLLWNGACRSVDPPMSGSSQRMWRCAGLPAVMDGNNRRGSAAIPASPFGRSVTLARERLQTRAAVVEEARLRFDGGFGWSMSGELDDVGERD